MLTTAKVVTLCQALVAVVSADGNFGHMSNQVVKGGVPGNFANGGEHTVPPGAVCAPRVPGFSPQGPRAPEGS